MGNIIFIDQEHEDFYSRYLIKCRQQDVYHMALVYCLGLNIDTRININSIYDFRTGKIKTDCLHEEWITSRSGKIIRIAFNLYNDGIPSLYNYDEESEQLQECGRYTIAKIFSCKYAKYFLEAIRIRYPEYCS